MDEKNLLSLLPRHIFYMILGHLWELDDQKNIALTCKQLNQWVYACSKSISDLGLMYDEIYRDAMKMILENNRQFYWKRDKNIWSKAVECLKQIPPGLSFFLKQHSTKLGRAFFQKVEYDIIHRNGSRSLNVIQEGNITQNFLNVLRQIPDIGKVIRVLDAEITRCQFFIDFMEMYRAGELAVYVGLHRKSLTEDYLLELECNNASKAAIAEAQAKINDQVLVEYARKIATHLNIEKLRTEQKRLIEVKTYVLGEPLNAVDDADGKSPRKLVLSQ